MWKEFERHLEFGIERVSGEVHEHAGILPSEMVVFLAMCRWQGVDCVIESGRRFGYSTRVLIGCSDVFETYSFDITAQDNDEKLIEAALEQSRTPGSRTAHVLIGDGARQIPELLSGVLKGRLCAVLIDGPKGVPAFELYDKIYNRVALLAVHDLHKMNEDGTENTSHNLAMRRWLWIPEIDGLGERLGHLDKTAAEVGGYESRDPMVRHGFHIGFAVGGVRD